MDQVRCATSVCLKMVLVHSPSISSFTSTSHNDFPQLPAGFPVLSPGLTSHVFMGLFLPTPTQQPPPAPCCLPLPAVRGSSFALPHILLSHLVQDSRDHLKPTEQGEKKPNTYPPKYSQEKSLKIIKKPEILRNCLGKQFFRKRYQNQDCLNQVRRVSG